MLGIDIYIISHPLEPTLNQSLSPCCFAVLHNALDFNVSFVCDKTFRKSTQFYSHWLDGLKKPPFSFFRFSIMGSNNNNNALLCNSLT